MTILVINDDGPTEITIELAKQLGADCWVPSSDCSGKGSSLSLLPIHLDQCDGYTEVDGTPLDTLNVYISRKGRPSLVVAGINNGINPLSAGCYSGTLSICRYAQRLGIDAVALSMVKNDLGAALLPDLMPSIEEAIASRNINLNLIAGPAYGIDYLYDEHEIRQYLRVTPPMIPNPDENALVYDWDYWHSLPSEVKQAHEKNFHSATKFYWSP